MRCVTRLRLLPLLLPALLLPPIDSLAAVGPAPLAELRAFLTQTTTARGAFEQRTTRADATAGAAPARAQLSQGSFEFQRPGRFRWSYVKPYQQLIVSDGEHLYLYDQDLNQVTIKPLQGALPSSPASILFGTNDFEHEFEVSDDGVHDGLAWILARPRAKDTPFERIQIGFHDGLPGAMRLTDSFGNLTVLTLSAIERNPVLDPARFTFTPPPGADVLQDR